jgi:hypothetical protein
VSAFATPERLSVDRLLTKPRQQTLELRWMIPPLVIFAMTRGVVLLVGYLANVALPSPTGDGFFHAAPDVIVLDIWARWDSGFYLSIANDGYAFFRGALSDVAFFPLYPLLIRVLSGLTHNALLAGVLVSNLSLVGALLILDRLTLLEFGDTGSAGRTVFYLAAFPGSVFFSAVYTESTFLLLSVATVYCARRQWWLAAGTLGALASATRIVGVALWPVLFVEWLRWHGWSPSVIRDPTMRARRLASSVGDWPSVLALSVAPLGIASYAVFLGTTFQEPLAFLTTQALWERENRGPLLTVLNAVDAFSRADILSGVRVYWNVPLDLAALALVLGVSVAVYRRLGAGYALYTLSSVLIPLWSSTISMLRFVAVLFPVFMMLGHWGRWPLVDRTISTVFLTLLGVCVAIFVNWIFLG